MKSHTMKSFMAKVVVLLGISALLVVGAPSTANATGNYEWQCLQLNGTQTPMSPGENLANCQGARLKKYLDGNLVQTIVLTGQSVTSHSPAPSFDCYFSIGLTILGVLTFEGGGWVAWIELVGGGVGTLRACRA